MLRPNPGPRRRVAAPPLVPEAGLLEANAAFRVPPRNAPIASALITSSSAYRSACHHLVLRTYRATSRANEQARARSTHQHLESPVRDPMSCDRRFGGLQAVVDLRNPLAPRMIFHGRAGWTGVRVPSGCLTGPARSIIATFAHDPRWTCAQPVHPRVLRVKMDAMPGRIRSLVKATQGGLPFTAPILRYRLSDMLARCRAYTRSFQAGVAEEIRKIRTCPWWTRRADLNQASAAPVIHWTERQGRAELRACRRRISASARLRAATDNTCEGSPGAASQDRGRFRPRFRRSRATIRRRISVRRILKPSSNEIRNHLTKLYRRDSRPGGAGEREL